VNDDNSHSSGDEPGTPEHLLPRKTPRQERSRALVDAIVEAAARVLIERGDVNTNHVAELAGVSVGSVYQYFPHKDSLLAALLERQATAESEFVIAELRRRPPTSVPIALEYAVDAVFAFRAQNTALQVALLQLLDRIPQFSSLRSQATRTAAEFAQVLAPLTSGIAGPHVQTALFVVCNAVFSLTHRGVLPRPVNISDAELKQEILALVVPYLTGSLAT